MVPNTKALRFYLWPYIPWVWVKMKAPGYGPPVLVMGSIYQGSMLGTHFFDPQPPRLRERERILPPTYFFCVCVCLLCVVVPFVLVWLV